MEEKEVEEEEKVAEVVGRCGGGYWGGRIAPACRVDLIHLTEASNDALTDEKRERTIHEVLQHVRVTRFVFAFVWPESPEFGNDAICARHEKIPSTGWLHLTSKLLLLLPMLGSALLSFSLGPASGLGKQYALRINDAVEILWSSPNLHDSHTMPFKTFQFESPVFNDRDAGIVRHNPWLYLPQATK
ncbi:hypothetical protein HZH66_007785 [Vespula vulgaris]|uniref:Uncharacterized protein n=1 Tax=Vespula vulgaris TaxID=7454 RepID=A0A834JUG9_VESVU|nr:hypothetical protein HZH66_007785 [Vespula vulgaris]